MKWRDGFDWYRGTVSRVTAKGTVFVKTLSRPDTETQLRGGSLASCCALTSHELAQHEWLLKKPKDFKHMYFHHGWGHHQATTPIEVSCQVRPKDKYQRGCEVSAATYDELIAELERMRDWVAARPARCKDE